MREVRVLVVDDSSMSRNTSINFFKELSKTKAEFLTAPNGKEALKIALTQGKIDLILLDWNMPDTNGLDFLKTARAHAMLKDVKIIMVTSEKHKDNVLEALKSGANYYVTKPINKDKMKEALEKVNMIV